MIKITNNMIDLKRKNKDRPYANIAWSNYDNESFYQTLGAEGLLSFAERGGLSSGCDIEALKPYWSVANSILDVGSGYGRVIHSLLTQGYSGTITAIERCEASCRYLYEQYKDHSNINLLQGDIHYCDEISQRFDLILFLWSGLADFAPVEQAIIIKKLATLLNENGKLIIDTMPMNIEPLQGKQFNKQSFLTHYKGTTVYTYEANINEIQLYANEANLYNIKLLQCKTDINRDRCFYILS